jgi:YcxB-like protein
VADDCFRAESTRGKTEVRCSAIPRIHVEEPRLVLYSTRRQAFIIPRRAFESDGDFETFAEAVKERWERRHRL